MSRASAETPSRRAGERVGAGWATLCLAAMCFGAACGSPRDLCDMECDCLGCSEQQLQDCYDQAAGDQQTAQDHDCLGEYDDLVSCKLDELACVDGALQTEFCLDEIDDFPACLEGD